MRQDRKLRMMAVERTQMMPPSALEQFGVGQQSRGEWRGEVLHDGVVRVVRQQCQLVQQMEAKQNLQQALLLPSRQQHR